MWELFRKYHYLNTDINLACRQFIGVVDGEIVCHTGVLPMPMSKNDKRLHRSVVLPDYQGIGIGMNFKNAICDYLRHTGHQGLIWSTTTTPAQYHAQCNSPKWKLIRYGMAKLNPVKSNFKRGFKSIINSTSRNRITYSFIYIGDEKKERLID